MLNKWVSKNVCPSSRNTIEKQAGQVIQSGWAFALSGRYVDENNYITGVTNLYFVAGPLPTNKQVFELEQCLS